MQDITTISKYLGKINFSGEKPVSEDFVNAVKITAIGDNKTDLKGFAVGKIDGKTALISTDKQRISVHELVGEMDTFFVDDSLLEQAITLGKITTYSVANAWLHLGFEGGLHFSILRKDHSNYPFSAMANVVNLCNTNEPVAQFTLPTTLGEVVERVTTLGSSDDSGRLQCSLRITQDKLIVSAEKNTGLAEEEVDWEKPASVNSEYEVRLPVKSLMGLAGKSTDCKMVTFSNKKAIVIRNEKYLMMASAK